MPTPLSDSVATVLRFDPTAALAALMVIATAHKELFEWATRALAEPAEPPAAPKPRGNGAARHTAKARTAKPPAAPKSAAAYHSRQRKARDESDSALLEAMRAAPDALIGDWAEAIGKSRSSTLSALKRLSDAGLAESVEGKWRLVESAPREPPPKWTAPVRGTDRAAHPHLT